MYTGDALREQQVAAVVGMMFMLLVEEVIQFSCYDYVPPI